MNISAKLIKKFDDYYLLDIDLRNIAEADDFTVFLFIAHFFQTEPYSILLSLTKQRHYMG